MPVCLIIPPSPFLLDERVFMSLGILKVAAALRQASQPVDVLDLSGISNFSDAVADYCGSSESDVFGITATTPQLPAATTIASVIRIHRPNAKIILGGPHVTLVNAARKQEANGTSNERASKALQKLQQDFDVLVAGDGEDAIFPALSASPGTIIDADDPRSSLFLTNQRLAELPLPARDLVDVDSYHYSIDGVRALSMIAQLGCPFECGFCGGRASPFLRRVRTRPSESVVAEMVHLHKQYAVQGFMMYDDELNVNRQMTDLMRQITRAQRDLSAQFRLRGFIKAELFTEEQAQAMYQAGFRWILVGFESGSPQILTNINKKASQGENTRCLEIAHLHGLKVKALMSVGHPGESPDTIAQTRDWLLAVKPDDFDVTIITTYPGTPYYDLAVPHTDKSGHWTYTFERTKDRLHSIEVDYSVVADYYKGRPDGGYRSFVYTDHLTPLELVSWRDEVENAVRRQLGIPYNPSTSSVRYEHSMGQHGLPPLILRTST